MNDVRDDAWDRRLDAGLAENEGGVLPPDVTTAVLARVAAGDPSCELHALPPRRRESRWLAAAMLLLGIGVVAGVWASRRSGDTHEQPAQSPAGVRDWRTVSTRAEIDALPADAKFVDGLNLGDDDVAALTRCTQLEGLRLRRRGSATNPRPHTLTPAAQTHLRRFAGLRALEVIGEQSLFASNLDVLTDLPLLVELCLEGFETDDAALSVLDRLPALRSLDLAGNHGFTGPTIQRLATLPGLLELRLYACSQLSMAMLAPIAELRRLQKLDLGGIGEIAMGNLASELERDSRKLGLGLTPAVAELVPNGLLSLGLSHTKLDDATMEKLLQRLSGLEVLDLSSNFLITDLTVASAVRLPRLHMLDLSGCRGLTPAVIDLLAASPLRSVRLQRIAWLTTGHAHRLMATGKEVDGVSQQQIVEPKFATVHSLADVQALAVDTTAVDALDLGADGVAALLRLRGLERLRLRYGEQAQGDGEWVAPHTRAGNSRSLGDADLAPLAALDALTSLELMGTVNLRGDGIRALAKLPKLAALRLSCFDVDDATMTAVARFPALRSLRIELVLGFAGEGMRAIAAAPRLEELTIAHCPQLSTDDVAALGRCTSLARLALRQLTTLRNDNDRQLRDDEREHRDAAQGRSQPALTDRALMGLQTLTSLRRLELTWGSFTSMALQTLADMRRLEYLDLTGTGELVPSALAHVPATVQTLHIGDCDGLDDHAAEVIRDSLPVLRELGLSHDGKLTDAFVETVLQIPSLRTLNLAQCTGLTAHAGDLLLAAKALTEVDFTGTRFIAQPLIEQLRSQGKKVRYAAW